MKASKHSGFPKKNCRISGTLKPDVVLPDIDMPAMTGIEGLARIRSQHQDVILMLTVFDDNKNIFEAIRQGANGSC